MIAVNIMTAVIILTAITLPIFHTQYIMPSFEKSILDNAEDEAGRVAEYIKHAIFQEHGDNQITLQQQFSVDIFEMTEENSLYLTEVIQDFKLKVLNDLSEVKRVFLRHFEDVHTKLLL